MFRLLMLGNKLGLQRSLVTRLTARPSVADTLIYRSVHRSRLVDGVIVVDVNLDDIAKGDAEFARSFVKSVSSLDRTVYQRVVAPVGKTETESPPLEDTVPTEGSLPPGASSSVLNKDGKPIVHIDIDGWNQDELEDTVPEQEKNNQDANIGGNDSADKK